MEHFKSEKTTINGRTEEVFEFLSKPANYEGLMPSAVRSFTATDNDATLDIQGLGEVVLGITDMEKPGRIEMKPLNKVPFKFQIRWELEAAENSTNVIAFIDAELNMMMKMMASGILNNFLNTQVGKLKAHFEAK